MCNDPQALPATETPAKDVSDLLPHVTAQPWSGLGSAVPLLGRAIKIRPLIPASIFQCALYFEYRIEILCSTNHTLEIRVEWNQSLRMCPGLERLSQIGDGS